MGLRIVFNTFTTLILRSLATHLHTSHRLFTMPFSDVYKKKKKQLDIKTKIIERSGFDEVMNVDDNAMSGSSSDYNTIKDNIQYKSSNR